MEQILIKQKTVLESQSNHFHRHKALAQLVARGVQAIELAQGENQDAEPPRRLGTGVKRPIEEADTSHLQVPETADQSRGCSYGDCACSPALH